MFDIMKVAQKIREARIAQNMTQMNLADAMEVSYQAVSNWERGNSCPDISKLEQLCGILHISMEELMGMDGTAKTVNRIINRENGEQIFSDGAMGGGKGVTARELVELAPLLPPDDVKRWSEEVPRISLGELTGLAPFLSREAVDRLAERCEEEIEICELTGLAPFLSREAVDRLAERCGEEIEICELTGLAPFLSSSCVSRLASRCCGEVGINELMGLAPFMDQNVLSKMVLSINRSL